MNKPNLSAIVLSVLSIPARTDKPVPTDPKELKYAKEAGHWRFTLTLGGMDFSGEYSMGSGHRRWKSRADTVMQNPRKNTLSRAGYKIEPGKKAQRRFFGKPETVEETEAFFALTEPTPPGLLDILECLQSDVRDVSNGETFEDWASNWGEEAKDSIRALRSFEACKRERDGLLRFFGREAFDEFMDFDFDAERERIKSDAAALKA